MRRPVAARRVERAAREQPVVVLDVEDALHAVEGLRPLRVAAGDLLQFARLVVVRRVKIKEGSQFPGGFIFNSH